MTQQPIWSVLRSNHELLINIDRSVDKTAPIFHTTELASLPPPMLASLYSGQAMSSIHSEVLPLLHS